VPEHDTLYWLTKNNFSLKKIWYRRAELMNRSHYKFLIVEQVILAFIINYIVNAAIGYVAYRGISTLPMWGMKSIVGDSIIMIFLLTIIVAFVVTLTTHKKVKGGHLESLGWRRSSNAILAMLPQNTFWRSLELAIIFTIIITPIVIGVLLLLNITEMTHMTFVIYKGLLAGLLAIIVAPLAAVCALGDA
jgi:hypothetical protein